MHTRFGLSIILVVAALLLAPATISHAQSDDGGVAPAIVGGQEATPGEYPWQAFVEIGDDNIGYYMCGGSLIAPQWVLTAAHCVDLEVAEASAIVLPSQVTVYLGKHNMTIPEPTQQIKRVARVIAYPNYNPNNSDGDLALLELTTPATLNSRVGVIPPPAESSRRCARQPWPVGHRRRLGGHPRRRAAFANLAQGFPAHCSEYDVQSGAARPSHYPEYALRRLSTGWQRFLSRRQRRPADCSCRRRGVEAGGHRELWLWLCAARAVRRLHARFALHRLGWAVCKHGGSG
ncbi:MAG: serine protease [Anaerolineales bacterium]|nr:serine protease [Anaerolineales bacterium]